MTIILKNTRMKCVAIALILFSSCLLSPVFANDGVLGDAYSHQKSDVQVQGGGTVIKLLSDDNKGSRHQRILIRLGSGQTILIAHNIDLAPRINDLKKNDYLEFYGEYEWNKKGGVIHWTHRDPGNRHAHGWLRHKGRMYN